MGAKRVRRRQITLPQQLKQPVVPADSDRRSEIIDTAARVFGSSGLRTSLQEIAEACGILPQSLYHHFESKDAIIFELVKRYRFELDALSVAATENLAGDKRTPILDHVVGLAQAIALCGEKHRAALLQTFYDPPATADPELVQLAQETHHAIESAMLEILQAAKRQGAIRSGIDLTRLAEQLCQSMLHVGVGSFESSIDGNRIPGLKCRALLQGFAASTVDIAGLDHSPAFATAEQAIASWKIEQEDGSQASLLRMAARQEFGRRGFESTTIRDIAAVTGISTGTIYRLAGSKDELLISIMTTYLQQLTNSWDAVMSVKATPVEKLDALLWIDINVIDWFSDEFKIQLAFLRESPPPTLSQLGEFTNIPRHLKSLLEQGEGDGHFRKLEGSALLRLHCLSELAWMSGHVVHKYGTRAALRLARETILRGAAKQ